VDQNLCFLLHLKQQMLFTTLKFSIFGNILLMDQKDTQILLSELNCYRFGNKTDQNRTINFFSEGNHTNLQN